MTKKKEQPESFESLLGLPIPEPARRKKPAPPRRRPDAEYMSLAEARAALDRWAAEQNEIAAHNARLLVRTFWQHVFEYGPENSRKLSAAELYKLWVKHLDTGGRHRDPKRPRKGKPPTYDKEEIIAAIDRLHAEHPERGFLEVTAEVAEDVKLIPPDNRKTLRKKVRRYYPPDKRW